MEKEGLLHKGETGESKAKKGLMPTQHMSRKVKKKPFSYPQLFAE